MQETGGKSAPVPRPALEWLALYGVWAAMTALLALLAPGELRDRLFFVSSGLVLAAAAGGALARLIWQRPLFIPEKLLWLPALVAVAGMGWVFLVPLAGQAYAEAWALSLWLGAWLCRRQGWRRMLMAGLLVMVVFAALADVFTGYRGVPGYALSSQGWYLVPPVGLMLALLAEMAGLKLPAAKLPRGLWWLLTGAVAYVLLVVALRLPPMELQWLIHHWKAYLESVESLRAGGWLLWDVPSQYGFLQTWLMAWMPTPNGWQSLYLLGGVLQFFVGCLLLWLVWRAYAPGWGLALGLVLGGYCVAGHLPAMVPSNYYPSTGPLRYLMLYALLAHMLWLNRGGKQPSAKQMWLGHGLWVLGMLWTVDSIIFSSVLWWPVLLAVGAAQAQFAGKAAWRGALAQAGQALGLLAAALAVVAVVYAVRLGHLPEVGLMFAYGAQYSNYMAVPITGNWLVAPWLAVAGTALWLAWQVAGQARGWPVFLDVLLLVVVALAMWAATLNYIPFSEMFHLTGTMPLLVMGALAVRLVALRQAQPLLRAAGWLANMLAVMVLFMGAFWNPYRQVAEALDWRQPVQPNVARHLSPPGEHVRALIGRSGMYRGAPLQIVYGPHALERMYLRRVQPTSWLLPNTVVGFRLPLHPDIYRRMAERRALAGPDEGWLIDSKGLPVEMLPQLQQVLDAHFERVGVWEHGDWRIQRFKRKAL